MKKGKGKQKKKKKTSMQGRMKEDRFKPRKGKTPVVKGKAVYPGSPSKGVG